MRSLVVGVGDWERGDEAAPLEVARRVAETAPEGVTALGWEGSPLDLIDRWAGYDRVVVVCTGDRSLPAGRLAVVPLDLPEHPAPRPGDPDLERALALATDPARVAPPLEVVAIGVDRDALHERPAPLDAAAALTPDVARAVRHLSERLRSALAAAAPLALDTAPAAPGAEATHAAWAGVHPADGTLVALEDAIRRWERADACVGFVTGEAAVRSTLHATHGAAPRVVAALEPGSVAARTLAAHATTVRFVPGDDAAALEAAIDDGVDQLWLATPCGPHLRVLDLARWARRASGEGAITVVDATGGGSVPPHPLALGVDLVVHADVAALAGTGAIGDPAAGDRELRGGLVAGDAELVARVAQERARTDARLRPGAAERLLGGFRSHPLRAERRAANALALARHLKRHPRVRDVAYPGLPGHPDAARVPECGPSRWGPTLACTVDVPSAGLTALLERLRWVRCGELGTQPDGITTTCVALGPDEAGGVRLRLTCGIEDADDLLDDLDRVLGAA